MCCSEQRTGAEARIGAARLLIVHPLDDGAAAFYAKYGFHPLGGDTTALYLAVEALAGGM